VPANNNKMEKYIAEVREIPHSSTLRWFFNITEDFLSVDEFGMTRFSLGGREGRSGDSPMFV